MSDQRNSRNDHHILFTGDFWHTDFQSIISSIDVPITLVPLEKSASVVDQKFDLIVIAQSRRDQFSSAEVEKIQTTFSNTPIVSLLGSWCEGETRSGTPYPGLIRVYWHQWQGRYQKFVSQLADANLTDWHAPATSSIADRISQGPFTNSVRSSSFTRPESIGISAWTDTAHEMLADAVGLCGWKSHWVERGIPDADQHSAIVIDAGSWTTAVENRINWLKSDFGTTPMVLLLNYPREDELESIRQSGISSVISKPFELEDLRAAIQLAITENPQTV